MNFPILFHFEGADYPASVDGKLIKGEAEYMVNLTDASLIERFGHDINIVHMAGLNDFLQPIEENIEPLQKLKNAIYINIMNYHIDREMMKR